MTSESRLLRMVAMYNDGKTLREIHHEVGISHEHVRQLLLAVGIKLRCLKRGQQAYINITEAKRLYDEGCNLREVGKAFGVPGNAISVAFQLRGMPVRQRGGRGYYKQLQAERKQQEQELGL